MLSCAYPAIATWVCKTTTSNANDTPPTFQNDPLHHEHTSSDVRSTNAVREAWSTSVSRPSPRQHNCKRQKTHTMRNLRTCFAWWRQRDPEYGSLRSQCPQHMFGQYMHMFDIIGTWSGSAKRTHAKSHNTCGTLHPILLVAQLHKRISMNNLSAKTAPAIATLNPHSLI